LKDLKATNSHVSFRVRRHDHTVSSTNKTDRHDITEILLKVALSTIYQPTNHVSFILQDYGPKVNFKRKKLKVADFTGLPEYSKDIYEKMRKIDILSDFKPVELCNLEYSSERGSSIEPHFDDFWLWGERLVTLNLLSDSVLCFTNENHPGIEVHVPIFRRSLLIVYGPARHLWKHAIHRSDILNKRLAITFRELSDEFKDGGPRGDEGNQLLDIAFTFTGQAVGTNKKPLENSEP